MFVSLTFQHWTFDTKKKTFTVLNAVACAELLKSRSTTLIVLQLENFPLFSLLFKHVFWIWFRCVEHKFASSSTSHSTEKSPVSHRGRGTRKFISRLPNFSEARNWITQNRKTSVWTCIHLSYINFCVFLRKQNVCSNRNRQRVFAGLLSGQQWPREHGEGWFLVSGRGVTAPPASGPGAGAPRGGAVPRRPAAVEVRRLHRHLRHPPHRHLRLVIPPGALCNVTKRTEWDWWSNRINPSFEGLSLSFQFAANCEETSLPESLKCVLAKPVENVEQSPQTQIHWDVTCILNWPGHISCPNWKLPISSSISLCMCLKKFCR